MSTKRAVIIGASSGIGAALAQELSRHGYEVGLTARREEKLRALAAQLPTRSYVRSIDVAQPEAARQACRELLEEMQDVSLLIINAGISLKSHAEWLQEKAVIDVNVTGFVAMANLAWEYFEQRGGGHIVGISSIAALKGYGRNTVYCASKAFISTYMQGLRQKSHRKRANILVSDIKPGFVKTPMTESNKRMFWVAPVDVAARQIYQAIQKRRPHAYVTRRWRLMAWALKLMPDWLFVRLPS